MESLQERFAPQSRCFGCGPANPDGLRMRSIPRGDEVVCAWTAEPRYQAFDGILNGGVCGALLDCHSGWAAIHHLMETRGLASPRLVVTADFHVRLRRPTPIGALEVRARAVETSGDRVVVEATIEVAGEVTASCRGTFVAVREGHPAFGQF